jgi:hypothetical protein
MLRVRPLTLAVIALALTSALLMLTLGTRQPRLLIAQLVGNTAQALLGIEFLRRRPLRLFGWILLALAAVRFGLLGQTAVRLLAR